MWFYGKTGEDRNLCVGKAGIWVFKVLGRQANSGGWRGDEQTGSPSAGQQWPQPLQREGGFPTQARLRA